MSADDDFTGTLRRRLRDAAPLVDVDTSGVVAEAHRHRRRTRTATATGVLALAAGLVTTAVLVPPWGRADVTPATASPTEHADGGQDYRFVGMVIGAEGATPTLCGASVWESYPPQCEGAPILGWDWSEVPAAESAPGRGATVHWGVYEVIGTWDGNSLTLTRPVAAADLRSADATESRDLSTPCPRPPEGWVPVDPARTSGATFARGITAAEAVDGFAVAWIDRNPGSARPTWVVLNVLTSGDIAATEAAVRQHWGGALCITGGASRSAAELDAVATDLMADGPMPLVVASDPFHGRIDLTVWVATPELQETYDNRYGPDVVELHSLLTPLD